MVLGCGWASDIQRFNVGDTNTKQGRNRNAYEQNFQYYWNRVGINLNSMIRLLEMKISRTTTKKIIQKTHNKKNDKLI